MPKEKAKYQLGSMVKLKTGQFGEIDRVLETREGFFFYINEAEDPFKAEHVVESYVKSEPRKRRSRKVKDETQSAPM